MTVGILGCGVVALSIPLNCFFFLTCEATVDPFIACHVLCFVIIVSIVIVIFNILAHDRPCGVHR